MNARWMIVAILVLFMLSVTASAMSRMEVSTKSYLNSYDTDLSVLRSITNNQISTPDLKLRSNTRVTTDLGVEMGGSTEIIQGAHFSAERDANGRYCGLGSISSWSEGIGVNKIEANIQLDGTSQTYNPSDDLEALTRVEAKCTGTSMASPGTNNYFFSMESAQSAKTNAAVLRPTQWMTEDPKLYSVSMAPETAQFKTPADSVKQDLSLNFGVVENELDFVSYDFSRNFDIGDVSFVSKMTYYKMGGWDQS